jgi:hypothetical protein
MTFKVLLWVRICYYQLVSEEIDKYYNREINAADIVGIL